MKERASLSCLLLGEMLSAFHHWGWCELWAYQIWPLLCWVMFPLCPLYGKFFIINGCWILSKAFSASIENIWLWFFNWFVWCITWTDLQILSHSLIPKIKPTLTCSLFLLMYCWIQFANILLRIFHLHSSVILACNFLFYGIFVWF